MSIHIMYVFIVVHFVYWLSNTVDGAVSKVQEMDGDCYDVGP